MSVSEHFTPLAGSPATQGGSDFEADARRTQGYQTASLHLLQSQRAWRISTIRSPVASRTNAKAPAVRSGAFVEAVAGAESVSPLFPQGIGYS